MVREKCKRNSILPNPRLVSSAFHTDQNVPSQRLTQLFTIFGQFVDHDLTLTSTYSLPDCCTAPHGDDRCATIQVNGDAFYKNGKCLNFVRSLVFCEEVGCETDPMNSLTAFVDGSNIYGSDEATARQLRTFKGGKLAVSGPSLLPEVNGTFKAGDTRALENPALGSMHTLFVREHNRIAKLIENKFPNWTDEKIFQHSRRLVVAEYSNIVFGEFLPLILGNKATFPASVKSTKYDPRVDPSIVNEFSTAAFRFGHTLLNGKFERRDPAKGNLLDAYLLRFNFDNLHFYKESPDSGMTSIIRGMCDQQAQDFDQFVANDLTNFLFAKSSDGFSFGEDLMSRNIQRGRDHSLQPWIKYRDWCGLSVPKGWDVPPPDISSAKWNTLKKLYYEVGDIDLFTGGLAEAPVPGGAVGPTFACIIQLQERNK